MTQDFLLALNAVVPFIFYMTFGYAVVHGFKMTDSDFLTRLNRLVFKCFFPVLMFNNFSKMDFSGGVKGGFILFTAAAVLLLKIQLPTCVAKPVNAIADMTTPISLFILGGTLKLSSFRKDLKVISISMGLKLIVIPAIALVAMLPFAFTPAQRFVVFAVFATPVAVSSFTMAANMGGDADLAGEFVAVSTIASLFTLFVWIVFLKSMGIV